MENNMTKEQIKQTIEGFTSFMRGISNNPNLNVPKELADKYDISEEFREKMEMTTNNLCDSCTNIGCEFQSGIVRTECAFYMPPQLEPDNCGNYVVMQSTVEAIPKDQYEARLKADMVAMLEELDLTIDEISIVTRHGVTGTVMTAQGMRKKIKENIQQKINALKGDSND